MIIQRNILFFPDREGTESTGYKSDAKLRMRIRYGNGHLVNFNVGYRVDIDKWIKDAQRCKAGTSHGKKKISAAEINSEIQRLEDLAETVFKTFEIDGVNPNPDEFRIEFNNANGKQTGFVPKDKLNFFGLYDEFTRTMGLQNEWTPATFTKFASIRSHLYAYNPNLSLANLSENDLQGFVNYLRTIKIPKSPIKEGGKVKKQYQIGLRNTTIAKNLAFVRWFLRWAYGRGYYDGKLHTTWKPKFKGIDGNQKEIIHLSWSELIGLYNFEVSKTKQYLERVRDVFCFQCFTSLRYSDVAKLSRSDVRDTFITVVTQKTSDGLKIELNKYSRAILDKYSAFDFPGEKVLPVISNVKMNEYLKELGELAGINEKQRIVYFMGNKRIEEVHPKFELLTTHCGRRTFIVNALYLGIPAEVVMKWSGHSDYKAMKPYIKIVDELKEQSMRLFDEK